MSKVACYEFGPFRLDTTRRVLLKEGERVRLPAKAVDLLLILIQSRGALLSKEEIKSRLWPATVVTDNNFNVTLSAVRKGLDETARDPQYIVTTPEGYLFVAEVKEIAFNCAGPSGQPAATDDEPASPLAREVPASMSPTGRKLFPRLPPYTHPSHMILASGFYGLLYATELLVEVAYKFDHYGPAALKLSPLVFIWVLLTSVAGLAIDAKLVALNKSKQALTASIAIYLTSAAALFTMLCMFLPPFPITELSSGVAFTAQAAYLKTVSYFLVLAIFFLILPFHFVLVKQQELSGGRYKLIINFPTEDRFSIPPFVWTYWIFLWRFWASVLLFLLIVIVALSLHFNLLSKLSPDPYMNLFMLLIHIRLFLYFALGVECLAWYYQALNRLRQGYKVSELAG